MDPSTLSIKNASGKTFSLLNDSSNNDHQQHFKVNKLTSTMNAISPTKRKYHCTEPGCNKSFTTSGHLARHNRIHTGEKNFHCLHPGCPSRFSRQDNMMQHYRTHLSQKLRRQHLRQQQEQKSSIMRHRPQLHCHSQHESEDRMLFQPLVVPSGINTTNAITRGRRSVTMPSLPYPPPITNTISAVTKVVNRPRRALSTSSTCSSSSSSSFSSPPPPNFNNVNDLDYYYHSHYANNNSPYHYYYGTKHHYQQNQQSQQKEHQDWTPNSQKSFSSLLHLANIVSTFG